MISTTGANLTKIIMFKFDSAIRYHIGAFDKLSEDYPNKALVVQVRSQEQGELLLSLTKLLSESISVGSHEHLNTSQGVITCTILKSYSEEDIVEGLSNLGVLNCRRIIKNSRSPKPQPTATLILAFKCSSPPDRIVIRAVFRSVSGHMSRWRGVVSSVRDMDILAITADTVQSRILDKFLAKIKARSTKLPINTILK